MDYINEYINNVLCDSKLSCNTISSYKNDLKKFSEYLNVNKLNIESLKKKDIKEYIKFLTDGNSVSTVHRNLATLKGLFQYLLNNKVVKRNIIKNIEVPTINKHKPVFLSVEEVDKLLSAPDTKTLKGVRDRAMLEVLYATGIKVSELITLKMSDVNTKERTIVCNSGGRVRIIPLGKNCYEALNKYLRQITSENEMLFVNMYNEPMSRQGFWKILKTYKDVAGIDKEITPKMLRHSFAAHLAQNGLEADTLKTLMGYSSVSSANVYLDMVNEEVKNQYIKAHPRA